MTNSIDTPKQSPFACVMDAIDADEREPHIATVKYLFNRVNAIRELDDGFAFRFAGAPELLPEARRVYRVGKTVLPFLWIYC